MFVYIDLCETQAWHFVFAPSLVSVCMSQLIDEVKPGGDSMRKSTLKYDLTDQVFDRLTVLERAGYLKGSVAWDIR